MIKNILYFIGQIFSYIWPPMMAGKWKATKTYLYSGYWRPRLKKLGKNSIIEFSCCILGSKHISIGSDCIIGRDSRVTAQTNYLGLQFTPSIIIGNNCSFGCRLNITAMSSIRIGNGVLSGNDVLITDNAHGDSEYSNLPPKMRNLIFKGEVVIGDNVWIGERVSILPGVHIGECCIIGSGATVTKDIPPYSVAVGNPAKVVKNFKKE